MGLEPKNRVGLDMDLGTTVYKQHWISWMRCTHQGLREAKLEGKNKTGSSPAASCPALPCWAPVALPGPLRAVILKVRSNYSSFETLFLHCPFILLTKGQKYITFLPKPRESWAEKGLRCQPCIKGGVLSLPSAGLMPSSCKPSSQCPLCRPHLFHSSADQQNQNRARCTSFKLVKIHSKTFWIFFIISW